MKPYFFKNLDLLVLLALFCSVAGLWAFIEMADEVKEGQTQRIDEAIILLFRSAADTKDPIGPPWLEESMRDLTALGGVAVLTIATAAVAGFLILRRFWRLLLILIISSGGALALAVVLKSIFARPRPDLVEHLSYVHSSSFPSGHSMLSAAIYLTLAALLGRLVTQPRHKIYIMTVALFVTFAVGLSRIYMGVHYPSDVLAGWSAGAAWASICWLAARFFESRC
ncbi:MAG: hypothetical protein A2Y07_09340 [Planctomycetes bacterium GWF2_50_10]|nr:MAG: hypothetical protein A2Y07_09340 [Planctomycetes bacterium GWF2_50_10]